MNFREMVSYEEVAIDAVVSVLNKAKFTLGLRQNLFQLAKSRKNLATQAKVALHNLECPLPITGAKLIKFTIERTWRLADNFRYHIKFMGSSRDECSIFYYFEVIFSQPTCSYPIPQQTASVFFRVENKHIDDEERVPELLFRIECHHANHDVRYVNLTEHWLLEVLQTKAKLFKRIEEMHLF